MNNWLDKYTLLIFDRLDSTNFEAQRLIDSGQPGEYVIVANSMYAGHGKGGAVWYSPAGNLYFSVVFQINQPLDQACQVSLVASVACCKTVQGLLIDNDSTNLKPSDIQIKWPNDLLLSGKKFCGILVKALQAITSEPSTNRQPANYLIVGVGINLKEVPTNLPYPATSLEAEGIFCSSMHDILHKFMTNFDQALTDWQAHGFQALRLEWLSNAANLAKTITCKLGSTQLSGTFKGIDNDGCLLLETDDKTIHKISSAEVFLAMDRP